jgi:GNAT superfamily N-acetyltransferase
MAWAGRQPQELRGALGRSARLWAVDDDLRTAAEGFVALSHQTNVVYNLACFWGSNPTELRDRYLAPILEMKRPSLIMLAGPGLGTAQTLIDAGWVSVAALPLMFRPAGAPRGPVDPAVRRLTGHDVAVARRHLAETYGVDDATAQVALPDRALDHADFALWGVFDGDELCSSVAISTEGDLATVWSMVTPPHLQGHGHGRRLLTAVLDHCFRHGATGSLLHSSAAGEPLYLSLGYSVVSTGSCGPDPAGSWGTPDRGEPGTGQEPGLVQLPR